MVSIASLDEARGNNSEAVALLERAVALQQVVLGDKHPVLAPALLRLGEVYTRLRRFEDAGRTLDRLDAIEATVPANDLTAAKTLHARAMLLAGEQRYADAVELQQRAIKRVEAALGDMSPTLAPTLNNFGLALFALDRRDEAEHAYLRSLAIYGQAYGDSSMPCAVVMWNLSALYGAEGRKREASEMLGRVTAIWGRIPVDEHQQSRWL